MSTPAVNLNELDGQLGTLPSGGKLRAIVGCSSQGPIGVPGAYGRTKDVVATFGEGPLVEDACYQITNYKKPVLLVRTTASVVGTYGTVVPTVAGTSVATANSGTPADDDFELYVRVINGGTVGSAGITLQYSTDNGRTQSLPQALGTAVFYVIPGTGGARINFAAGTLLAGDIVRVPTIAPNWNATDLGVALTALKSSAVAWEMCSIYGITDATAFAAIATAAGNTPNQWYMCHCRMPTVGETEAAYLTAMNTIFSGLSNPQISVCYGAAKTTSGLSFRQYRRPIIVSVAARQINVSEEIDIARIDLGALPGVDIRDANGNPDEHDELQSPGADDARFLCLRTHEDSQGVYVNNPNMFSATGSDFQYTQHRRVMNLAKIALRAYFKLRLSKEILVDAATGFILEEEALEIEAGATAVLEAALRATPKVSATAFTLSRIDNLLSTKTLNGQASITPLAYPKTINLDVGFKNPALQTAVV